MSNREKLLWAAVRLFHQQGYQGTSIDQILQASGVRRSNLYYHFRTKEELAAAALDHYWQRYRALIRDTLERLTLPPRRRLTEFLRGVQALLAEGGFRHGCPVASVGLHPSGTPEALRRRSLAYVHDLGGAVAACIRAGVAEGDFPAGLDAAAVGMLVVAACQGGMLLSAAAAAPVPLAAAVAALEQLLGGTGTRSAAGSAVPSSQVSPDMIQ